MAGVQTAAIYFIGSGKGTGPPGAMTPEIVSILC